jgi:putative endonuclease
VPFRNPAERRAARWYRARGYRILATNAWIARNELDIVARRGATVVFCEVKSKEGDGYGDPLEMVTPEKVRRVRHAAEAWLATHPAYAEHVVRFDVLALRGRRVEHVPNAF